MAERNAIIDAVATTVLAGLKKYHDEQPEGPTEQDVVYDILQPFMVNRVGVGHLVRVGGLGFEVNNLRVLNNFSNHIDGEQTLDLQLTLTRHIPKQEQTDDRK